MHRLLCCVLLAAAVPLALASLGVDVSIPVSQSQFSCMKGQGYTFAMYVLRPRFSLLFRYLRSNRRLFLSFARF